MDFVGVFDNYVSIQVSIKENIFLIFSKRTYCEIINL